MRGDESIEPLVPKLPSKKTLDKYGLSAEEWLGMWGEQGGHCPICLLPMKRPVVDHFHIRGWKAMPPQDRKKYVRQLLCFVCNYRILTRGVTPDKLRRAMEYLMKWESKRPE